MLPFLRAVEKLNCAVRTLTLSDDPLRVRLENAYAQRLAVLDPDDFPPHLRDRFLALRASVTWQEDERRGRIAATCAAISDREAIRVAGLILELADLVAEAEGGRLEQVRAAQAAPPKPLALNSEMAAPEIASVLRRDLPAQTLAQLTDALVAEREHMAKLLRRVERKHRRRFSPRPVLGVGSNDRDDKP